MNRPMTSALLLAAALVALGPLAAARDQGEVEAQSIEATSSGAVHGGFAALFIDHLTPDQAVPAPGLLLESPDVVVTSKHAPAKVGSTAASPRTQPVHEGSARIEGVESRPDLHLWVVPLHDASATLEVRFAACTSLAPRAADEETRRPVLDTQPIMANVKGTAATASCTDARAVIRGDLVITAWEWDFTIDGERVNSGVNDTSRNAGLPATGAGSADELTITVYDATLTIPLTAQTYELFIGHPDLEASELRLIQAHGTLPGLLEPIEGEDVELLGDYAVTIDPAGSGDHLRATITGTTNRAEADGVPMTVYVPVAPGERNNVVLLAVLGVFLTASAASAGLLRRYRRPLNILRFHPDPLLDKPLGGIRGRLSAGLSIMADAELTQEGSPRQMMRAFRRSGRLARRAAKLDPQNGRALFVLGGALARCGDMDNAREAFRLSQELAHGSQLLCDAVMAEAELTAAAGRMGEAASLLVKACGINARRAADVAQAEVWDAYGEIRRVVARLRLGIPFGTEPDYHT